QFFIDNLSRTEVNFVSILYHNNKLFRNDSLFNPDKYFDGNLNAALNTINYNFKMNLISNKIFTYLNTITVEEYKSIVYYYIRDNEEMKAMIKDLAFNILKQFDSDFILRVFTEYEFENNESDFISVIIKYMNIIYKNVIKYIIIHLEKQSIFASKIFGEEKLAHLCFDNIYETYINTSDLSISKFIKESGSEDIDLILGITFPCIITIFDEGFRFMKSNSLLKDYKKNENQFISKRIKSREYHHTKRNIENTLKEKVFKHQYFNEIFENSIYNGTEINNYQKNKLLDLFFNDFIHYYLSKTNKKYFNSSILKFFKVLYSLFAQEQVETGKDDSFDYDKILNFTIFIELYRENIENIIKYILAFDMVLTDYINSYISQLSLNMFIYEDGHNLTLNILNNLYETVIYCIITNPGIKNSDNRNMIMLINDLEVFTMDLKKLEGMINQQQQYIYNSQDLIHVLRYFVKHNIPLVTNINKYLIYLKKENQYFLIPEHENICKNSSGRNQNDILVKNEIIQNEFNYFSYKFKNNEDYLDFLIDLINIKLKIENEIYRIELLRILCTEELINEFYSDNSLKNKLITSFETIFSHFNILNYDQNEVLKFLDRINNTYIEDIINQIFTNIIMNKFNNNMIEKYMAIEDIKKNTDSKYASMYCNIYFEKFNNININSFTYDSDDFVSDDSEYYYSAPDTDS
ncbi:hypothetical protein BCR36DRAFT_303664, partial [Piromyces finnis]